MLGGATGAWTIALLFGVQAVPVTAQTLGQQVSCSGSLPNGWTFAAEALDGRFLHIIWTGTQGQTRVSLLSHYTINADNAAVFRGTLQDAIEITLVDTSGGIPMTGTEVAVFADEWGWFAGTCRQIGGAAPEGLLSTEVIRHNLMGTRDSSATNWLRRNGFSLVRVVTHSSNGKTERWQQDPTYPIDVVFAGGRVADVSAAPQW
jgi:hypothetical protein